MAVKTKRGRREQSPGGLQVSKKSMRLPETVERWRFTVSEYYQMAEAGILREDDRVELIEGEVIEMSPIGSKHAACVARLVEIFGLKVKKQAIVWVQNPLRLADYSEPEPDIALLKRRKDFYAGQHPTPPDVLLIVEVADTSVEYDRNVKAPLYARAGIPEVWIIDLVNNTIEVFSQPENGEFQTKTIFKRGDTITSATIAGLAASVEKITG